ncbi:unnamed protein product, partial [Discosporangium mesarthrocarpum]
ELEIPLFDEKASPYAAKQRRYSPTEKNVVQEEVDKLYQREVIRPAHSPRAAACITARKSNLSLRLVHDYRLLTWRMRTYRGGLGDFNGVLGRLSGSKYLTTLDLASGFFQIPIKEECKSCTAL